MFAKVPEIPGLVQKVAFEKPDGEEEQGQWVECGTAVNPGWHFSGSTFSPPQSVRLPVEDKAVLKAAAYRALVQSDTTLLRCLQKNASVAFEWAEYRKMLRQVVNDPDNFENLPERPEYPTGT